MLGRLVERDADLGDAGQGEDKVRDGGIGDRSIGEAQDLCGDIVRNG
jgi:hypothetical protein